jgi:hypothetical protein
MKATTSTLIVKAVMVGSVLLMTDPAMAQPAQPSTASKVQPAQPPAGAEAQPATGLGGGPRVTSSNRWETLPERSVDRCLAEAIGTATDPKTGAPARANVDPQTGKPLCPTPESTAR